MKVFTVRDLKAQLHLQPFFEQTSDSGIRAFKSACSDPKTNFYQYPEDYTLHEIGSWDQTKGMIIPYAQPVVLASASQYATKQ